MTTELFANDYVTTLAQECGATDTTLYVADPLPAELQASGEFRLKLANPQVAGQVERVIASMGVSTTTLTVVRGAEGNFSTGHDLGSADEVEYRKQLGAKPGAGCAKTRSRWRRSRLRCLSAKTSSSLS